MAQQMNWEFLVRASSFYRDYYDYYDFCDMWRMGGEL